MATIFIFTGTTGLLFLGLLQVVTQDFYSISLSLLFSGLAGLVVAVFWDEFLKQFFEPDPIIEEAKLEQKNRLAENNSYSPSVFADTGFYPEDSLQLAEVAQYASAVFGVQLKKPYSKSAPEFLGFVIKISTTPSSFREKVPRDYLSKSDDSNLWLSRLRYLQLCLRHMDALTDEDLELIDSQSRKEIPELKQALSKRRKEKVNQDRKKMGDIFADMRRELVNRTNLDIPIDESDEEWVSQVLASLVLDYESETSMKQFLATNLFLSLNSSERQSFAEIRAKFGLWKSSVQKHNWAEIGGPDSALAKKAFAEVERQRLDDEAAAARLGEERFRAQKLADISQSLTNLFSEQLALHRKLQQTLDTYREVSLVSKRAKWLHERERPEPQPYGVSAMGAESLVADWLAYLGETGVVQTQYVGDGGVDVFTDNLCVQVKNYEKQTVSSSETRDIFGTATSESLRACIFTSSRLSVDSLDFAEKNSIIAIHYNASLSALIALTSSGKEFLLEGEYEEA